MDLALATETYSVGVFDSNLKQNHPRTTPMVFESKSRRSEFLPGIHICRSSIVSEVIIEIAFTVIELNVLCTPKKIGKGMNNKMFEPNSRVPCTLNHGAGSVNSVRGVSVTMNRSEK